MRHQTTRIAKTFFINRLARDTLYKKEENPYKKGRLSIKGIEMNDYTLMAVHVDNLFFKDSRIPPLFFGLGA